MIPKIAIIENNTLSAMSLKGLLWEMFPQLEVVSLNEVGQMEQLRGDLVVHWFVNSSILFSCSKQFESIKESVIALTLGQNRIFSDAGYKTLDVSLPEKDLARAILMLHHTGHPGGHPSIGQRSGHKLDLAASEAEAAAMGAHAHFGNDEGKILSPVEKLSTREIDVLVLMVKGLLNKEIASELNISLPTVVFHRNNIYEKLGTRSIGKLTIMAVIHNLVPVSEI